MTSMTLQQSYVTQWHSLFTLICSFAIVFSLLKFPLAIGYFLA